MAAPILGATVADVEQMPMVRVYAALHIALIKLGYDVELPGIIKGREKLSWDWLKKSVASAQPSGLLNLD